MSCTEHNWMLSIDCPVCAAAEKERHVRNFSDTWLPDVGATGGVCSIPADPPPPAPPVREPEPEPPYIEPGLPDPIAETLVYGAFFIPAFLRRRQGGTGFTYPSLHEVKRVDAEPVVDSGPSFFRVAGHIRSNTPDLTILSDYDLLTALSDETISAQERQPFLTEARRRDDRNKEKARKLAKADQKEQNNVRPSQPKGVPRRPNARHT